MLKRLLIILYTIIIFPIVILGIVITILEITTVTPTYWIITGGDYLEDKTPIGIKFLYFLYSFTQYRKY